MNWDFRLSSLPIWPKLRETLNERLDIWNNNKYILPLLLLFLSLLYFNFFFFAYDYGVKKHLKYIKMLQDEKQDNNNNTNNNNNAESYKNNNNSDT